MKNRIKASPDTTLKVRTAVGYGLGDLYGGGATTLINVYYLIFLTDVLGIPGSLAGLAFLISKLWDAVTDPFMGIISDNTRTRHGRRRPYFLAGVVLIFVSFFIMWIPVDFPTVSLRFAWVLFAYLSFSTVYTMVWVPYNAIAAELTDDYQQRVRLSTYRMIFSNLGGIMAATLPLDLFVNGLFDGNARTGFAVMAFSFGLLFALPYLATFFFCQEKPEYMHAPRTRVGKLGDFLTTYFTAPLQLKPFRNVVGMYLFAFMAQDAVLALAVYLMTHVLGTPSMMTLLIPVYGSLIVAVLLMRFISAKLGKRRTYMLSALLWLAALSIVFVMREGMPILYLYIFGVFFGFGLAGVQVMVFAMFPDVPDADEFLSGARREGIFSGIFAFARKTGGAFTLFLIGLLIDAAGYQPAVDSVSQVQSEEFKLALRFIFFALPGLYLIGALWAARRYSLTRERMEQIRQIIRYRNRKPGSEQAVPPVSPETEAELKKVLGGAST